MTSAAHRLNAQASMLPLQTTSGASGSATLDDSIGVTSSEWSFIGCDDSTDLADWTVDTQSLTGCTWTAAAGANCSAILQCRINGGGTYDERTGRVVNGGDLVKTTKIYIGTEVLAFNETLESDAAKGWIKVVNPALRAAFGAQASVTYASTIEIDFTAGSDIVVGTLTAGITIDPPVGLVPGHLYTVTMTQDAGGFNLAAWDPAWVFPDGLGLPCQAGGTSTTWTFRAFDSDELRCIHRSYSIGHFEFTSGAPNLVPGIVNILSGTAADPQLPDAADWVGMANAVTVKLRGLSGGAEVHPSGADEINDETSYVIAEDWGQVVIMSTGTGALLASPGLS